MAVTTTVHCESQGGVSSSQFSRQQSFPNGSNTGKEKRFELRRIPSSRIRKPEEGYPQSVRILNAVQTHDTKKKISDVISENVSPPCSEEISNCQSKKCINNQSNNYSRLHNVMHVADPRRRALQLILSSMESKGLRILIRKGDVILTYSGGAKQLQIAKDLGNVAKDPFALVLAKKINTTLAYVVQEYSTKQVDYLYETLAICSYYLADYFTGKVAERTKMGRACPRKAGNYVINRTMHMYPAMTYHGNYISFRNKSSSHCTKIKQFNKTDINDTKVYGNRIAKDTNNLDSGDVEKIIVNKKYRETDTESENDSEFINFINDNDADNEVLKDKLNGDSNNIEYKVSKDTEKNDYSEDTQSVETEVIENIETNAAENSKYIVSINGIPNVNSSTETLDQFNAQTVEKPLNVTNAIVEEIQVETVSHNEVNSIILDRKSKYQVCLKNKGSSDGDYSTVFEEFTELKIIKKPSEKIFPAKQLIQNLLYHKMKQNNGIMHEHGSLKMTYKQAFEWLQKFRKTEKSVEDNNDVKYLQQKFAVELSKLVGSRSTVCQRYPLLQEVIFETSFNLAVIFVAKVYMNRVSYIVIKEMQKQTRRILIKIDNKIETYATSALRLILAKSYKENCPDYDISQRLAEKLTELTWLNTPNKMQGFMKEYIKKVSDYLSCRITKPDPNLISYIILLTKMEQAGDRLLTIGKVSKSFIDCAKYLKSLTSYIDHINKPNSLLQASIENKIKQIVVKDNVTKDIIKQSARLITSFVNLSLEYYKYYEELVERLDRAGKRILVWHDNIRKTCQDGANLLRGKTPDELKLGKATIDSVVYRKVETNIKEIIGSTSVMKDLLKLVTKYLTVRFLEQSPMHACKDARDFNVQCKFDYKVKQLQRCEYTNTSQTNIVHLTKKMSYDNHEKVLELSKGDVIQATIDNDADNISVRPLSVEHTDTENTQSISAATNLGISKVILLSSSNVSGAPEKREKKKLHQKQKVLKKNGSPTLYPLQNSRTPLIPSGRISDWRAIVVNLMWNTQAWQKWIQEHINIAEINQLESTKGSWKEFKQQMTSEIKQWRLYNIMTREMTLHLQIEHFQIKKTTFASILYYQGWLQQLLSIENVFNQWMLWFSMLIKETKSLRKKVSSEKSWNQLCWDHYKKKTELCSELWETYNTYLSVSYTEKYSNILSSWLPIWSAQNAIWVYSAHGVVPCGAVSGGTYEGEQIWVAKVTTGYDIWPAAVHPMGYCAWVYTDNSVNYYNEYQVLCNAKAAWVVWQDSMPYRPIMITPGIHIGRVKQDKGHLIGAVRAQDPRCQVVMNGRPVLYRDFDILVDVSNVDVPKNI